MDTNAYRARLEEEKTHLEGELSTVGRRNPGNPNDWEPIQNETGLEADPGDQAQQMDNYQENTAILTDLENRYNEVQDALKRIDDGSYGTCRICGKEIEAERLDAEPAADTCKEHRDQ
jgi:RNA polymerase-binding transcription factor DksA